METIIKWKTGVYSKANPAKVYSEITSIGEEVTPEQVLEKAKDKKTELNKCFNWNDADCAYRYRLIQAGDIMRQLIVITRPEPHEATSPVQFRLMMKNENTKGSGFKQVLTMVKDENEYQKLLAQAMAELQTFKQKYSCLAELSEIISLIP